MDKKDIRSMLKFGNILEEIPKIDDDIWTDGEQILCESCNVLRVVSGLIEMIIGDECEVLVGYYGTGEYAGYYYIKF